jgi:hypothetical protein
MAITVLDSTDTAGILADAGITLDEPTEQGNSKPMAEGKEIQSADETSKKVEPIDDDEEDGNGLTAAEREGLTERMQKTIGKQYRKRKEAEEFAAAQFNERRMIEQRAADLERENAELKAKTAPKIEQPAAPTEPQRENFANEAAYVDAMIQFHVDKRMAEKADEDRKAAEKRRFDERIETAKGRILRAIETVPDFEETVMGNDTTLSPEIGTYLEESEMVAELTYYFAKNPEVLASLEKLSPHSKLVKIGKIESTLSPFEPKAAQHDGTSSSTESNGKASKAAPSTDTGIDLSKPRSKPAPVFSPLDGSGSAGHQVDPKDMNVREAIEDFAKRNRTNLNARKRH